MSISNLTIKNCTISTDYPLITYILPQLFVKAVFYEELCIHSTALIFAIFVDLGAFVCLSYNLQSSENSINCSHFVGALPARTCTKILKMLKIGIIIANPITLLRSAYNDKFVNQRALAVS